MEDKVDMAALDKEEKEKEEMKKRKEEVKAREERERLMKGRPGKGHKPGYVSFCRGCFTEFTIEMATCSKCGQETISYEVC